MTSCTSQKRALEEHALTPAELEERKQALAEQQQHRLAQKVDLATCGAAFIRDSGKENALAKLSRYETSMARSLFRTLHELQTAAGGSPRKGRTVPLAVDIDVIGPSAAQAVASG